MARDYSPTHFFLRVPNCQLGRYSHERHGVLQETDFVSLNENGGTAETIFLAVLNPDDAKQALIEAECQEITTDRSRLRLHSAVGRSEGAGREYLGHEAGHARRYHELAEPGLALLSDAGGRLATHTVSGV